MAKLSNTLIESWKPDPRIAAWADKHHFGPPAEMSDQALRALTKKHPKKPVGIYLWESANHEIYIGISNASVCTRLRQHVANHPGANIQRFRFRANSGDRSKLREIERELIYDAIDHGFTVFNREHSAIIFGDSVFDAKVPVAKQEAWFKSPVEQNHEAERSHTADPKDEPKARQRFDEFAALPEADAIIDALAIYLKACTPFPIETEEEYWSLTCLPGWSKRRLATLNMAYLEMFFAHYNQRKQRVEIHIGTDYQFLPRRRDWFKLRRLGVRRRGLAHVSGGPNEEMLLFKSVDCFKTAMTTSPEIRQAAARFALDRMRKSRVAGRYREAHNVLLADAALERMTKWDPAKFKAAEPPTKTRSKWRT